MTAKELIEKLQQLDPETLILVDGYESDYDDVRAAEKIEVYGPFEVSWWEGRYRKCREDELFKTKAYILYR